MLYMSAAADSYFMRVLCFDLRGVDAVIIISWSEVESVDKAVMSWAKAFSNKHNKSPRKFFFFVLRLQHLSNQEYSWHTFLFLFRLEQVVERSEESF